MGIITLSLSLFSPLIGGLFISSTPGGASNVSGYVIIECPTRYYSPHFCSVVGTLKVCSNTTKVATLYCYDGKNTFTWSHLLLLICNYVLLMWYMHIDIITCVHVRTYYAAPCIILLYKICDAIFYQLFNFFVFTTIVEKIFDLQWTVLAVISSSIIKKIFLLSSVSVSVLLFFYM